MSAASQDPLAEVRRRLARRAFLQGSALRLGGMALASLLGTRLGAREAAASALCGGGLDGLPHHPPTAKRIIYLFMSGGPSQMDLFDYKPKMEERYDEDLPDSIRMGQRITTMTSGQARFPVAPSKFRFEQHGECRAWVSELLPWTASMVDDLTIVRSVHTNAINHDPAMTFIQSGHEQPGRPSLGAWLSYGLGSENDDLPAYVVMTSRGTGRQDAQALFSRLWGTGFLPSEHQGVQLRSQGDPVLYLSNPPGVDRASRRRMLDRLRSLNERTAEVTGDPETEARISQYEMAFRMQASVPELLDLTSEPESTFERYGPEVQKPGTFAYNCLLARRLAERGVRFIQLFHRGWDQHFNLVPDITRQCYDVDQPAWALVQDLKERGLLDDTIVIWGGEFGRTIYCQGPLSRDNYGRDHHPRCFTMWMAGGGFRAGLVHGETDDYSYNIVRDPVSIYDLNATLLHCLGIDHERLTYRYQGRDFRLTDTQGVVQKALLA